jgi:hypothetical protein
MELSLSNEFGTRIETLLMELVKKTNQDAHLQLKTEMGVQIGQQELRLGQLEEQIKKLEQFRSTSLNVLQHMLDETRSDVTRTFNSTPTDDAPHEQPRQLSQSFNLHQPEHEPVTISDVQRFLMQRQ